MPGKCPRMLLERHSGPPHGWAGAEMRIFCATTGRTGSLFVSEVFRTMTDYPSFHEARPWLIGSTLAEINTHEPGHRSPKAEAELAEKILNIELAEVDGRYFESSQMFIKAFAERALDDLNNVACIYLWRNPIETLISRHKKCTEQEADWILQPEWPRNALRSTRPMSFFETVLWEWFEVRERFYRLRPRFKKTYVLEFSRLNDVNEWDRLFDHFGVRRRPNADLPRLRRNNIDRGEAAAELDAIFGKWSRPPSSEETKYDSKRAELEAIDAGIAMIARNSALMNAETFK